MNRMLAVGLGLLLIGAGLSLAGPGAPDDAVAWLSFDVHVAATDPFDPANQANGGAGLVKVRRGQTVRVEIKGVPKAGYHTYPLTKRTSSQDELSHLSISALKGVVHLWPIGETEPVKARRQADKDRKKTVFEHEGPFTWTHELLVSADVPPGRVEVPFHVATTVCNEKQCLPFKQELTAVFEVTAEEPVGLTPEMQKRKADPRPSLVVVKIEGDPEPLLETKELPVVVTEAAPLPEPNATEPAPAKKTPAAHKDFVGLISVAHEEYKARMEDIASQVIKSEAKEADAGLLAFLLAGIFWGGVSLITPCVFPMIPITVSYFLKQSEKEHHSPIVMASVYSLTIVVVLTLAAAFLLSVFRELSIHPAMNYFLGGLFIFFALSLFGMYEIELPSGLARFTSAREGRGGLLGTVFMALTFTIISFACVAPFLGGFGGTAAAARPLWHNLLGGLAFSTTFAAPFFFLALFPTLLRAMPKSGSWLNSVKVVMGFLELAAAFKFLRGAELLQSGGDVTLFSYDFVLGIWIALSLLCGLYLIGSYNLPHDTPSESIGVPRLLFSAAFLGLAFYLLPALFKVNSQGESQRPGGAVYAWVDAFLLPESNGAAHGSGPIRTGDLHYAVAKARDVQKKTGQPKRVFVDFTGLVCANCRFNEKSVFSRSEVQQALAQYINVELYTDGMPTHLYAPDIRAELAKDHSRGEADATVNAEFQLKVVDENTLPIYAILEPRSDGRIELVRVYRQGRIMDVPEFMNFLTGEDAK